MSTETDIANLHRVFSELTRRNEPARFHTQAWLVVLSQAEYRYNAAAMEADMRQIVAYLLSAIRDGKRNDGALKLRNFLQPDTWFADLEEARAKAKNRKHVWQEKTPVCPETAPKPQPVADVWEKGKAAFADMKKQLSEPNHDNKSND